MGRYPARRRSLRRRTRTLRPRTQRRDPNREQLSRDRRRCEMPDRFTDDAMSEKSENDPHPEADQEWFRQPTPRERRIAASLFIGFGIFFILLFIVLAGWWFRWIILIIGIYSCIAGARHALAARKRNSDHSREMEITPTRPRRFIGVASYLMIFLAIAA